MKFLIIRLVLGGIATISALVLVGCSGNMSPSAAAVAENNKPTGGEDGPVSPSGKSDQGTPKPVCLPNATLQDIRPSKPDSKSFVPSKELPAGQYALTEFKIYFSEKGRNGDLGEAALVYQLATPGSFSPTRDFYLGFSAPNSSSITSRYFRESVQVDPSPRVIDGKLIYNPMSTFKWSQSEKAEGRYVHMKDLEVTNKAAFNPQELFNETRLAQSGNQYIVPGSFTSFGSNPLMGGLQPKANGGFDLYMIQYLGILGLDGEGSVIVMSYEKQETQSKAQCPAAASEIRIKELPTCGPGIGSACNEKRVFKSSWTLYARTAKGSELWQDDQTRLIWSERSAKPRKAFEYFVGKTEYAGDLTQPKSCAEFLTADELGNMSKLNWEIPTKEDFESAHTNGLAGIIPSGESKFLISRTPDNSNLHAYCFDFGGYIKPCAMYTSYNADLVCVSRPQ